MSALPSNLVLAEKSVPRYTSYPTAPHFSDAIGPDQFAGWLGALPAETGLSLYLHVPYCRELCTYCGCHTRATRKNEPLDAYAETLAREIDMVAKASPARRGRPRPLGRRHAGPARRQKAARADRFPARAFQFHAGRRNLDRTRSAPRRRRSRARACRRGLQSRQPRRAGFQPACAGGHRPHPAVRGGRARRRPAARRRIPRHQSRPDVRPALPDRGRRGQHRRTRGVARPEPSGFVRLRPRALVRQEAAADRRGGPARRGRAPAAGRDGPARRWPSEAMSPSASIISPCPTTRWPSPCAPENCGAISRAIPWTRPTRCCRSAPRRSAACRKAMSRTPPTSAHGVGPSRPDVSPRSRAPPSRATISPARR